MCASRKRIRRSEVNAEEWVQHRKLRKKIASAKWYAKKKQAEIEEEHRVRQELAEKLIPPPHAPVWPDAQVFAHWHASLDHHLRGFPVRPASVPVTEWIQATRCIQEWLELRLPRTGERGCDPVLRIPWSCTRFGCTWRALAVGEWMHTRRSQQRTTPWVGWTCSVVGAAYVAWYLQSDTLSPWVTWGDVARAITHVATVSTMMDHTHPSPPPQRQPPIQNPTKNTERVDHSDDHMTATTNGTDTIDPMLMTSSWSEWTHWMNRFLFDPYTAMTRQEEDRRREEEEDTASINDGEDSNTDWMDDYLQPFLTSAYTVQPWTLDHPPSSAASAGHNNDDTHSNHSECGDDSQPSHRNFDHNVDGGQPDPGASYSQSYESPWPPDPEPSRWICATNTPPSTYGSDVPDSPVPTRSPCDA